ncbi:MAG: NAD-dependent epimerase/dehydratase family protein, partial [Bacteroidia bacterium]|nr:NAD-dependent epimerase/dehydratase family protein [Bacteroidia bacterium]
MNQGSTILITGGTGMIGKELTKALLGRGYNIIILTRQESKQAVSNSKISYGTWNIK